MRPGKNQIQTIMDFGPMGLSPTVRWELGEWYWISGKPWRELLSCENHGWIELEQATHSGLKRMMYRVRSTKLGVEVLEQVKGETIDFLQETSILDMGGELVPSYGILETKEK